MKPLAELVGSWRERQVFYWDHVARQYDSLYADNWSKLEDHRLQLNLERVLSDRRIVLDLACGTGLVNRLAPPMSGRSYCGIDLSQQMLDSYVGPSEGVTLTRADCLEALCGMADNSVDAVTCVNGSMSFLSNSTGVIDQIVRVLVPGGILYVSFLNASSVSRLKRLFRRLDATYSTRHANPRLGSVPATFWSVRAIRHMFQEQQSLAEFNIVGTSLLAGWLELRKLWRLDRVLTKIAPFLSHSIDVTARKASDK